ncbi:MAG: hypothetical protein JWR69_2153 [Pedosphaera sp.]|nr:hypothetical protein [Pedosphaera sp.]
MRIGLVSAGFPPDRDGIGDYTWWLAKSLAKRPEISLPVEVYTGIGAGRTAAPDVEVVPFFDLRHPSSFGRLKSLLRERNLDWVVLQYNPFSFGKRGFCPWVPWTLATLRSLPNTRVAAMFHEACVPKWPAKYAVMYSWQRPIFNAVCRAVEVAFVSTERWTPQVRRAARGLRVHHLPVGSNIPVSAVGREEARARLGFDSQTIVLGFFGTAHPSRQLDWIAEAVTEVTRRQPSRRTVLLYVGPHGDAVRMACPSTNVIDAGHLDPAEVGVRLRAMDAVVSPFSDGVSTRRGSILAALQHGIPVASTRSQWTDQLFASTPNTFLLSSADCAQAFADQVAEWLEQHLFSTPIPNLELEAFYENNFHWDRIALTLLTKLASPVEGRFS